MLRDNPLKKDNSFGVILQKVEKVRKTNKLLLPNQPGRSSATHWYNEVPLILSTIIEWIVRNVSDIIFDEEIIWSGQAIQY